jgi:hypothetical protein
MPGQTFAPDQRFTLGRAAEGTVLRMQERMPVRTKTSPAGVCPK